VREPRRGNLVECLRDLRFAALRVQREHDVEGRHGGPVTAVTTPPRSRIQAPGMVSQSIRKAATAAGVGSGSFGIGGGR
jgi:hypothetical protein